MDGGWLKHQLESRLHSSLGLSTADLCATIFDILSSAHSDDQIQNEVCVIHLEQFAII